jgi:NAD(P)-dependent dehydrogenase (short-subunit alcohol dehydrogenase family)
LIASKGTILNIVSNASHMPMTTSLAYNASKGAAHIMTLQMARELSKAHGITVFGISPNKLRGTEMSKDIEDQVVALRGWTPEYAKQYQLASLLAGEETDPDALAEFVAFLLSSKQRHKYLTGCILPYGA